jgi:hypothetical protein
VRQNWKNELEKVELSDCNLGFVAEGVGFEPTREQNPLPVFKTGALNHSATLPRLSHQTLTSKCAVNKKRFATVLLAFKPRIRKCYLHDLGRSIRTGFPATHRLGGAWRYSAMRASVFILNRGRRCWCRCDTG